LVSLGILLPHDKSVDHDHLKKSIGGSSRIGIVEGEKGSSYPLEKCGCTDYDKNGPGSVRLP